MHKTNNEINGKSLAAGIGIGTIIALVFSLILTALVAVLIAKDNMNEKEMNIFSLGIQLIAAMIGGIFACKTVRSKYMIVAGVTSLAYLLVLWIIAIVFFGGIGASVWKGVLAIGFGFASACTVCISREGKRRYRKRATR